jgi:redox-sensitive bicupin YhaK (pirin superfamily)
MSGAALAPDIDPVVTIGELGFPWAAADPFLFCVHHEDAYPRGNDAMAPVAPLTGRELGNDFSAKDGWSMYHGEVIPGFPAHPHRGFETVTVVREGLIDHFDSLGATARFGAGDVQWLTAGRGILHSEMMPLLNRTEGNRSELFQIWLNLPARHKMAPPHFKMLWADVIPCFDVADAHGRPSRVSCMSGLPTAWESPIAAVSPPPDSWAAQPDADVGIWTIDMSAGAALTLPPAAGAATRRTLYFFKGDTLSVANRLITHHAAIEVRGDAAIELVNGDAGTELLLLQGRPIGEPVVQHGPFVMNTPEEIRQAVQDYQRTRFGGWPWPQIDPVSAREAGRFARRADGMVERPAASASAPAARAGQG